jgi:hypothetical protein
MLAWLGSLSLPATTAIVVFLSAVCALLCVWIRRPLVRWSVAVASPFAIAYCMYWSPVWMGADPSGYGSWAGPLIGTWSVAGLGASVVVLYAGTRWRRPRAD